MNVKPMPLTMAFLDERIEFIEKVLDLQNINFDQIETNFANNFSLAYNVKTESFSLWFRLSFIKRFISTKHNKNYSIETYNSNRSIAISWFDEYYQAMIKTAKIQFDTTEEMNIDYGGPSKHEFNMSMLNIHSEFMKNI